MRNECAEFLFSDDRDLRYSSMDWGGACVYVTVHMETHAVYKRRSSFANGLKSERSRQYKNREDARLQQQESRKDTRLRATVESE